MDELKNKLPYFRFMNHGMTQQELAEILGITRQTVLAIEKGKFNPSARLALQMARVFKVSVEEIFYLEEVRDE